MFLRIIYLVDKVDFCNTSAVCVSEHMRYIKLLGVIITFCLLGVFILRSPKAIVINEIECKSQFGSCNQNIVNDLNSVHGLTIAETKKNVSEVLNKEFLIKEYSYQYSFPDKLKVNIIESKSVYALKNNADDKYYLVDAGGNIISTADSTNLPILETHDLALEVGEELENGVKFSGDLLYNVYYSHQTKTADLKEDGLYMQVEGIDVVFPLDGDEKLLVGSLNAIITRLRSDYEKSKIDSVASGKCVCYVQDECRDRCTIDLRFKNPVII